ncbi:MAG: DUF4321 domain-containing protein [bacterium]
MRHKSFWFLLFMVVLGMIVGTAVGEAIGLILPDGVVKNFFLRSVAASVGPATVNLVAFTFTLGFSLKINLMSVLGVVVSSYLFRWY